MNVFNPPESMTLWNVPAETEDQFDSHREQWIEKREEWEPFFEAVAVIKQSTVAAPEGLWLYRLDHSKAQLVVTFSSSDLHERADEVRDALLTLR